MRALWGGPLLVAVLISGCAGLPLGPLRADQIYADAHCGREATGESAHWIADNEDYRRLYRRLDPDAERAPPPVRFSESIVVLIEQGRQPTRGYGISLADPEVELDGRARLRLNWQTPPPDALSAQVISSPCVLVRLPRADYSSVVILDQLGRERLYAQPR